MTDLLSQLLHDEADGLDVPPPDTASLLVQGRQVRRRQRATTVLAAAAAVAAIGTGALLLGPDGVRDSAPEPAAPDPVQPVFAVGSRVYVDGHRVELPGTVHSLHYTSAGVVVRTNDRGGVSDGSGTEALTLVRPDGSTTDLGDSPEGQGPVTDVDQPYVALARQSGGDTEAVVRDAGTGEVVSTVALPSPTPGAAVWLSLDDDVLYADLGGRSVALDWRTGEPVALSDAAASGSVRNGVVTGVGDDPDSRVVVDPRSGEVLLTVPMPQGSYGFLDLSPDGRYALRFVEERADTGAITSTRVYDVATGTYVSLAGAPYDLGWTPDGHVFSVADDTVRTCSPTTGTCTETAVDVVRAPEPSPVQRTETTCDRNGENCGTMVWTEPSDEPANHLVLGGRSYDS